MQVYWLDILPILILAAGGLLVFCAGAFLPRRPAWLLFALALATTHLMSLWAVALGLSGVCVVFFSIHAAAAGSLNQKLFFFLKRR